MNKYLPSKKFIVITSLVIGVGVISLISVNYFFSKKNSKGLVANIVSVVTGQDINQNISLRDLIQKDSDGDGIFDWEEALWGTDPNNKTTNEGISDKDFIEKMKKERAVSAEIGEEITDDENLNETIKFSKEFYATLTALKQSGNLDEGVVSNIGNVVGDKINNVNIADTYRITDLAKTYDVTKDVQKKFYETVSDSFAKYSDLGIGEEFDSIDLGTGASDEKRLAEIAQNYQDFSREVISTLVPNNLIQIAMTIANSAYNTGEAIKNISKLSTDPLLGLIGLSQYQKYSEELIKSSENLRSYMISNDII